MISEAGTCEAAAVPSEKTMSVGFFEYLGLLPLGGEDSVRLVRGVRPLVDAFRFWTKACEFEVKTDEAALPSELAEPTPRSISPLSVVCVSSESGEVY